MHKIQTTEVPLSALLITLIQESAPKTKYFQPIKLKKLLELNYDKIIGESGVLQVLKKIEFESTGLVGLDAVCRFVYEHSQGQNLL